MMSPTLTTYKSRSRRDPSSSSSSFSWLKLARHLGVFALQLSAGAGAGAQSSFEPSNRLARSGATRRLLGTATPTEPAALPVPRVSLLQSDAPAPGTPPAASTGTFTQPLWHGEDSRIEQFNGSYYSVWRLGNTRLLYKSPSLVDRGAGKVLPFGFPLFAPKFIKSLNGEALNTWVAIGTDNLSNTTQNPDNSLSLWVNPADPYDHIDQWSQVRNLTQTFKAWSIDFELFENPQAGPYQGLYLTWAGAESPSNGWHPENIYIAKVLSLRTGTQVLSTYDSVDANKVAGYRYDWSGVVKEGPGTWINADDSTLCLAYSGNGANTLDYAVGYTCLLRGQNPAVGSSWFDHNAGGDDEHKDAPELAGNDRAYGYGVVRFTPSPDGKETWALAHSKTFAIDPTTTSGEQQDANLDYYRHILATRVTKRQVQAQGQNYTLPVIAPAAPGDQLPLPSGDSGPRPGPRRIEAEEMHAYGLESGPTVQGLSRFAGFSEPFGTVPPGAPAPNITADDFDTDVLTQCGLAWSGSAFVTRFEALAQDQAGPHKQSGLYTTNVPAATQLVVASASVNPGDLNLSINGVTAARLRLPATGNAMQFVRTQFAVNIPKNAVLGIDYVAGTSAPANIDYIDLLP